MRLVRKDLSEELTRDWKPTVTSRDVTFENRSWDALVKLVLGVGTYRLTEAIDKSKE